MSMSPPKGMPRNANFSRRSMRVITRDPRRLSDARSADVRRAASTRCSSIGWKVDRMMKIQIRSIGVTASPRSRTASYPAADISSLESPPTERYASRDHGIQGGPDRWTVHEPATALRFSAGPRREQHVGCHCASRSCAGVRRGTVPFGGAAASCAPSPSGCPSHRKATARPLALEQPGSRGRGERFPAPCPEPLPSSRSGSSRWGCCGAGQ